jgi:hypothetical protein
MRLPPEQAQLAALDDQFQAKVLAEAEARAGLERDKEALGARCAAELAALAGAHERELQEVAADFTARQQARAPDLAVSSQRNQTPHGVSLT